jgi:hypothetical protein
MLTRLRRERVELHDDRPGLMRHAIRSVDVHLRNDRLEMHRPVRDFSPVPGHLEIVADTFVIHDSAVKMGIS